MDYVINEGDEVAFYGPKIDFHLEDSIGRTGNAEPFNWIFRCPNALISPILVPTEKSTVRVMIHRVVFGSIERFIGILIEHYAGAFPTWLAPVQVRLLSITDRSADYIKGIWQENWKMRVFG